MSVFVWHRSFELGIEQFDEHHKHLVDLLNKTFEIFTTCTNHEFLEFVLDELLDYATYHFAAEERWMEDHGFTGLQKHHEEHEKFRRRFVEIRKDYHSREVNLTREVLNFLKEWLFDHILKTDAEYARFAVWSLTHTTTVNKRCDQRIGLD